MYKNILKIWLDSLNLFNVYQTALTLLIDTNTWFFFNLNSNYINLFHWLLITLYRYIDNYFIFKYLCLDLTHIKFYYKNYYIDGGLRLKIKIRTNRSSWIKIEEKKEEETKEKKEILG